MKILKLTAFALFLPMTSCAKDDKGSSSKDLDGKPGLKNDFDFHPNRNELTFNRGSSQCCGPVQFGNEVTKLNMRVIADESDLPNAKESEIYMIWLEYLGNPTIGKDYPVEWFKVDASDPNKVYLRVIPKKDSEKTWAEQGVKLVKGRVKFLGLVFDSNDTSGQFKLDYEFEFSNGKLSGSILDNAQEELAMCPKVCKE